MDNSSEEHIKRSLAEVVPGKTLVLTRRLARLVVQSAAGRVGVIASGQISDTLEALMGVRH